MELGRTTSAFIRMIQKSVDMPYDSDVFRVPSGYNAPQQYNSKYYYEVGIGHTTRTFWLMTPPEVGPDVPYTFGLIGLGRGGDEGEYYCPSRGLRLRLGRNVSGWGGAGGGGVGVGVGVEVGEK
ncbi:Purple acid phosphatase 2 [Camellia lanceoleosa]|uniref:Purple acid phosphatase 2 n=1 Tax=Camellia lanceoleosa TaxID=1840588 RepID=A0ACC0IGU6_9ERIC|nr:Purple acid phosphatase 2 [Camellia lanceoleosa]